MIKSRLQKLGFLGFVIAGQAALAQAERSHAYLAKNIPPSSSNCHEQAVGLAQRFTSLTGLASTGRCESESTKGNSILIQYQGTEPLHIVTSAADLGLPGQGYEFASKAQCEKEITGEIQAFASLTGSEPLIAFCRSDENYYGRVRWALVVEGFGSTKTKISWASSLFPGQPTIDQIEQIKIDVKNKFDDPTLKARHVFLQDSEHGHLRLTVNYHGKYDEQLKAHALAAVNTPDQCQLALGEMRNIIASSPDIKTLSYCINNPYRRGADLVVILDVTRWYKIRQSAESFTSYEQCQTSKPALVRTYRDHYPETILGGFCSEWGSSWKINLLEKP